jgi:hypothetical protein
MNYKHIFHWPWLNKPKIKMVPTGTITRMDAIVNAYLSCDPLDAASTIEFLQQADRLANSFEEIPRTIINTINTPQIRR